MRARLFCFFALFASAVLLPSAAEARAPQFYARLIGSPQGAYVILVNDHVIARGNGGQGLEQPLAFRDYLVGGKNTVSLITDRAGADGGFSLSIEISGPRETLLFGERPEQLLTSWGFTPRDAVRHGEANTFSISFTNHTDVDNAARLQSLPRCNDSPEHRALLLPAMRAFADSLRGSLAASDYDAIVRAAGPRLADAARNRGVAVDGPAGDFKTALREIAVNPGYAYDPARLVFLPTWQGRLWRVVAMRSEQAAWELQERVQDEPYALPEYDYDLFQSKEDRMPVYIGLTKTGFAIVR